MVPSLMHLMSLRARLLLGFVAIALVLIGADLVLAANVQKSLSTRSTSGSSSAIGFSARGLPSGFTGPRPPPDGHGRRDRRRTRASPQFFLAELERDGTAPSIAAPTLRDGARPPAIDGRRALAHATSSASRSGPTRCAVDAAGLRYRVAVQQRDDGNLALVAVPLREADATLSRLMRVEVAATRGRAARARPGGVLGDPARAAPDRAR